ncbi:MAG: putative cytokinetic ring protein SteA [Halanaerobiaceae bacterium]
MIRGKVVLDKKTKDLVKKIRQNQIAVIDHRDIDRTASKSLAEKKIKGVINLSPSISGKYPNTGPLILLKNGIAVIDVESGDLFSILKDGDIITFKSGIIYKDGNKIGSGKKLTIDKTKDIIKTARNNLEIELEKFIDNTLVYAEREKEIIINISAPDIGFDFTGCHVLIVVRGADYKEDLEAIKSYIREMKPVIIAVDGGADACLENGYYPDIIIGDMDSVSDRALQYAEKIVVHAYPEGKAPGLQRIKNLNLDYTLYPAPGTSEDIAMILAYEKGAELIVAVGTHSHMIDFLDKGRPGMASTLLARLRIGDRLVDAKGVSRLYRSKIHYHYWFQVLLAIFLPLLFISTFSPPIKQILQLLVIKFRLFFNR